MCESLKTVADARLDVYLRGRRVQVAWSALRGGFGTRQAVDSISVEQLEESLGNSAANN
jgi:hypothetical protein